MDDLISRQAAIEYFMINTNWHDEEGHSIDDWDEKRKLLEDYFNGVPSAQPEVRTEMSSADLISRQAAIAYAISGRIRTLPTTEDGENWIRVSEVRESLIAMPSAQQERKVGKWLSRENEPKHQTWWTCSRCTGIFDYKWNYCPNCGAYMRERKEE